MFLEYTVNLWRFEGDLMLMRNFQNGGLFDRKRLVGGVWIDAEQLQLPKYNSHMIIWK